MKILIFIVRFCYNAQSVTEISENAFEGSDSVVIHCYTDSAAHVFAVDNEIDFLLLDKVIPPEEHPSIRIIEKVKQLLEAILPSLDQFLDNKR